MLYQVRYILSIVVEADEENAAGKQARKSITAHAENDWWNAHLLDIEVEKLGELDSE